MEQKSSLTLVSGIPIPSTATRPTTRKEPASGDVANGTPLGHEAAVSSEEDRGAIKMQFRKVYKNLRTLVLDLLKRERTRHGLTGRRKQTEVVSADLRGGIKTSPSDHDPRESRRSGRNIDGGSTRNGICDTNNKTVLDTLSTIMSSCTYDDDDWDPLVNTITAPLDDTAALIRPGLYISGFLAEQNKADLQSKGITCILQVGENLTRSFDGDFEYKSLAVMDTASTNVLPAFKESLLYLHECISSGGAALVHCYAGISRSATICIAYLMWSENLSLGAAYSLVERARSVAQPNEGFRKQLQIFESLGSNLGNLDQYLASSVNTGRTRHRELSSDDWDSIL